MPATVSTARAFGGALIYLAVTDSYEYDAFGNALVTTGSTPNVYLYRGEQYDPDLGLYYLRARYYNPATGRFMSRDPENGEPLDPKSLHKYLYTGGDPVNGVDPMGREDLFEYAGKVAAVVFTVYNTISPALTGHDFAKCVNNAFTEEVEDINAVTLDETMPVSSNQIASELGKCEGVAIANLIKGPWGLLFH